MSRRLLLHDEYIDYFIIFSFFEASQVGVNPTVHLLETTLGGTE